MKTAGPISPVRTALLLAPLITVAGGAAATGMVLTPGEIEWVPNSRVPGLGLAKIEGDVKKHGAYVYRVRFPPGRIFKPHRHPDDRTCTVLSGTWHLGWGETYAPEKLTVLPAGSFYTEPAGAPHFAATPDGEVVIQVTGTGPTAVYYVDPERTKAQLWP